MASTYTTNSGIEKPGDGEQSGTWGDTVNTNMDIIDTLVSGFIQITAGSTSVTLTTTDGSVTAGMNKAIKYVDSGDLGGNCTVTIAPNDQEKLIFVENGLSASRSLIFTQGSGANFTLQAGKQAIIRSDGAGSGAAVSGVLANLEITTLEVTGAAALDGAATLGSTLTVTGASQFNSTITAGVDDTGYDVKFFGDTASRYWLWDTSADGVVQRGALTVGVDDTGHDVKFFGATSGRYMEWDESQDVLRLSDNVQLQLGTGGDLILYHAPEHSYIQEGGSGNLYIQGTNLYLQGRATGETMLGAVENGAVELYYDASKKIETTTDGVRLSDASSVDISTPLLTGADHTCTGLTAQMLAGGTISAFDLVCVHTTTGEVVEADASAYATARVIGIAPAAISDTATGTILLQGFIRDDSWSWTTGSTLYLSETQGAMTHTPPSTDGAFVNVVGVALEPDVVYINPSMDVIERA